MNLIYLYLRAIFERGGQFTIHIPYEYCAVIRTSRYVGSVSTKWHACPITANLEVFTTAISVFSQQREQWELC